MNTAIQVPPVVKTVRLPCPPAEAFRYFTDDFGQWWPYATHSLGLTDNASHVAFEGGALGRLYEVWKDGTEHLWGSVTVWDPPRALAFSWHVGRDPSHATEVRLSFQADGGGSLVQLTHSKWEKLGVEASTMRERYDSGWGEVFERRFREFARGRAGPGR